LTHRIEKWLVSLGFALRKAYWKILTAKPSIFIVAGIVAALSIFLLGGGIYDILEKPMTSLPWGRGILFFFPGLQQQFLGDSLFAMFSYAIGVVGILLMYQSTKYAYKPRQAFMLLLLGAIFIIIAYVFIEYAIFSKLFPPQATSAG